jgi:LysR family glycine cleavage system transcriptional activator
MSSLPPLDAFHVLAACVRHGSFSRAAAELRVTPSAVSARIRGLESVLGIRLFERRGPKLSATPRALHLASAAEGALEALRSAVEDCHRGQVALRVTCAPSFARWLLPRLASYTARYGEDVVTLDANPTLLSIDRFDVAIRAGRGGWHGLACELVLADHGTPMVSPKLWGRATRAPSVRRLLELPLIQDPRWTRWLRAAGAPEAKPRLSTTRYATYELDAAAAARGVGIALLSPVLYRDLLRSGTLLAPFQTHIEGPDAYWAVWKEGTPMPRFLRWLRGAIAKSLPEHSPTSPRT